MANKLYIQKDGERIVLVDESEIPSKISDLIDDSNFINTSQTVGLIKNDGTIDTNTYLTSHQDITGKENISNKVLSLSSSSTDTQYPSAKCVYDYVDDLVGDAIEYINR